MHITMTPSECADAPFNVFCEDEIRRLVAYRRAVRAGLFNDDTPDEGDPSETWEPRHIETTPAEHQPRFYFSARELARLEQVKAGVERSYWNEER
jgi:hypothetical protein